MWKSALVRHCFSFAMIKRVWMSRQYECLAHIHTDSKFYFFIIFIFFFLRYIMKTKIPRLPLKSSFGGVHVHNGCVFVVCQNRNVNTICFMCIFIFWALTIWRALYIDFDNILCVWFVWWKYVTNLYNYGE